MLELMQTLIRGLVVCSVAALMPARLISAPPMVQADPVATIALVLKVVGVSEAASAPNEGDAP
jgi:hypothetical protein